MMKNQKKSPFIGRKSELKELSSLLKKKSASLVVVKGRRRVGKSRLIAEFAKDYTFFKFTGLSPADGITAQDQRNSFADKLSQQTGLPSIRVNDWSHLFTLLASQTKSGRVIILFDEISWMSEGDPTFLSKLKNAWDDEFKQNPRLLLILCGSVSLWIEDNIISSKAFFGRISWTIHLNPLPLSDCNKMLEVQGFKSTAHEKFKILSVTGGIPWYIEQMQGQFSADENIQRQCFTKGGSLTNDFDRIFHELFEKKDELYKKIIMAVKEKPANLEEISEKSNYAKSGRLKDHLQNIIKAGFLSQDYTWSLKTGKTQQLWLYRLSDNYLRFYIKYILPRREQIEAGRVVKVNLSHLPGWETIMGLQFENLVVNSRNEIYPLLNIDPESVIYDNPFFQKKTTRQLGCQIDFLIQCKHQVLYVFEIKFLRKPVGIKVVNEVKEKISRISTPKGMAILPVLVHVNGVTEQLIESNYFHSIIDFSQIL